MCRRTRGPQWARPSHRHPPHRRPAPSAGTVTREPPKRILRTGEEERGMASDAAKAERAKADRFAKPRAIGCAVVAAVALAVVLAWFLGFFGWLAS